MLTTLLLFAAIVIAGTRLSDGLRLRQEELILKELPLEEAHAYYELLKRRVRRVKILRAITLASFMLLLLGARRRFVPPPAPAADPGAPPRNSGAARLRAEDELGRHAARLGRDPRSFVLKGVSGDESFPWIFDYAATGDPPLRVRFYVNAAGHVEVHEIVKPPP